MGATVGDEEEGKEEPQEELFGAGTPRQPLRRVAAAYGDREGQPTFR